MGHHNPRTGLQILRGYRLSQGAPTDDVTQPADRVDWLGPPVTYPAKIDLEVGWPVALPLPVSVSLQVFHGNKQ